MDTHRPRTWLLPALAIAALSGAPGFPGVPGNRPLASALVRSDDAVPTRGPWGEWRRHFRGDTHGAKDLIVLVVHLKPGQEPHPPHRHAEEEVMILAEGAGTWQLDGKELPARKGDIVYAAPWSMHGIKSNGDGPLTYYMVKWSGKGVAAPGKPGADESEEAALARIRELGGRYRRDLDAPGMPVVKISFDSTPVGAADLKVLAAFPELRELNLGNLRVTDAALAHLADLVHLQELDLRDGALTGQGFRALAKLQRLQVLRLAHNPKLTTLKGLGALKQLRWLDLGRTHIGNADLQELSGLENLETLMLESTSVTDVKHLVNLPRLEQLDLNDTQVNDAGLAALANLPRLTRLQLSETPLTNAGMKHVGALKQLRWLNLDETEVTGAGLGHLAELQSLESLSLRGSHVESLRVVPPLRKLHTLNLLKTRLTEDGLDGIQRLTGVRKLHLGRTQVIQLKPLSALRELRDLDARNSLLTNDCLKTLVQLDKLERLVVDATRITEFKGIGVLKELRVFGACGTPLGDEQMMEIAGLPQLRELYLMDTKITDTGLLLLTGMAHLQIVGVGGTGVSETGMNLLRIALPKCSVR